jgi:hypothetical protein
MSALVKSDSVEEEADCPVCHSCYVTILRDWLICPTCAAAELAKLREKNSVLREALEEIAKGEGAFSRDPLTHAANCIDRAVATAKKVLEETK